MNAYNKTYMKNYCWISSDNFEWFISIINNILNIIYDYDLIINYSSRYEDEIE